MPPTGWTPGPPKRGEREAVPNIGSLWRPYAPLLQSPSRSVRRQCEFLSLDRRYKRNNGSIHGIGSGFVGVDDELVAIVALRERFRIQRQSIGLRAAPS